MPLYEFVLCPIRLSEIEKGRIRIEDRGLSLLLLRRAPRALESGPSERQHFLGVGREDSEWGQRTTKGVLPEAIEVGASLQPVFECLQLLLAQRARRVGCRIQ